MTEKRKRKTWWIYFILWCLYLLQRTLFSENSVIAQGILVLLIVWSGYHFIKSFQIVNKPRFFIALDLLLIMFFVYGTILLMGNEYIYNRNGDLVSNYTYLRNILISLLPIYSFYYYSLIGQIGIIEIKKGTILLLVVAIASFFQYQTQLSFFSDSNVGEITNNQAYSFLFLLPCFMLFDNKVIRYGGMVLCAVFIVLSMKRGAILVGSICFILFIIDSYRDSKFSGRFWTILGSIVVAVLIYKLVIYEYETNDYFVYRIDQTMEGSSSGRDELVSNLLRIYSDDYSFSQQLVGSGANATIKYVSKYAHNDWVELLINQGLLGVILYVFYWLSLIKAWRNKNISRNIKSVFGIIIIIMLLKTVFSMSYTDVGIFGAFALGYFLSLSHMRLNTNYQNLPV